MTLKAQRTQAQLLLGHAGAARRPAAGADLSPCRAYRYRLWRILGDGPALTVIGLNPSTADETEPDPTITRLTERARRGGFGMLMMLNLFAYRATDPREMKHAADPIGPDNDGFLLDEARAAGLVLCAWGTHGTHRGRALNVTAWLRGAGVKLHVLRLTKGGHPEHPLYLPYDLTPTEWTP